MPKSTDDKTDACAGVPRGPWVTELDHQGPLTSVPRDLQIEALKREVETLRSELDKIKLEVRGAGGGAGPGTGWAAGPTPTPAPLPPPRPSGSSRS